MRLLAALRRKPLDRPPIWFMRQAGRYLPEYQDLRRHHSFEETIRTPALAAEVTLQPIRRFPLDAAIIFADIMTPLEALGIKVDFDPGPRLRPLTVEDVARLREIDLNRVGFVFESIASVRAVLDPELAVIGFAGGPVTLLAYLLEGGGSTEFNVLHRALEGGSITEALTVLARAMQAYLAAQVEAGADVVQLFDSWAGLLPAHLFEKWAVPAARLALTGLGVPTIYFAPRASHLLERFPSVGATAYGLDWRLPLGEAWRRLGEDLPVQGNLDPVVLLSTPAEVQTATMRVLDEAAGRPGHVFNLGHGILPDTPLASVEAMVETVVGHQERPIGVASRVPTGLAE